MRPPVKIDDEFEREAKRAARTCWVCQREFKTQDEMSAHKAKSHPNWRPPQ